MTTQSALGQKDTKSVTNNQKMQIRNFCPPFTSSDKNNTVVLLSNPCNIEQYTFLMAWSFCSSCTSQICYCCSILHNTGMNRQTKEILASSHLRAYNMERRKATNKLRRNEMNFCRKECLPLPQGKKKKKKAVISDISVPYLNLLL